ncbi:MAG: YqgE/AlgH family protein [Alphaproteobacteria bacterium]|nr:YqgE/AlgH family protein [Alphaproteobacteria bacterium]
MTMSDNTSSFLAGKLLVATPAIQEAPFVRSVIYMCVHNAEGAMGIITNVPVATVKLKEIFDQLDIDTGLTLPDLPVHFGGPVESYRGFVLHSAEQIPQDALYASDGIVVSASVNILQKIANGQGPEKGLLMLGYAGWGAGQLEQEIEGGSWLVVPASRRLVFETPNEAKWNMATASLGFDIGHFSTQVGHA